MSKRVPLENPRVGMRVKWLDDTKGRSGVIVKLGRALDQVNGKAQEVTVCTVRYEDKGGKGGKAREFTVMHVAEHGAIVETA